jgi:hypothetical protein
MSRKNNGKGVVFVYSRFPPSTLLINNPACMIPLLSLVLSFLIVLLTSGVTSSGTIQLPRSGQTNCYNTTGAVIPCAGTGQDMFWQGLPGPIHGLL